jgi:Tfp pilus assembly protein PilF
VAWLMKCVEIDANARRLTLLGVSQLALGMDAAARDSFERAITIDPRYEKAYYNLGVTFRDEPQRAMNCLERP